MADPIQLFSLTMSSTLAGLKPLILHSFIEYTQFVAIDDTDAMPLCKKKQQKQKQKQNTKTTL